MVNKTEEPAIITVADWDGNPILIDQHRYEESDLIINHNEIRRY